jgi:predicted Zn finger-like uncharacterized protein
MKFLCPSCKAKYQIADEKVAGRSVRMKCRKCGHMIAVAKAVTEGSVSRKLEAGSKAPSPADKTAPKTPAAPTATPRPVRPKPPLPAPRARPAPARRTPLAGAPRPSPARPAAASRSADAPPWAKRQAAVSKPPATALAPAPRTSGALADPATPSREPAAVQSPAPTPSPSVAASGTGSAARAFVPYVERAGLPHYDADDDEATRVVAGIGALAGAFSQAVRAPESSSLISAPADEWYVGINGVPVGPMRLSELRSKAASGGIGLDSLVWREGFEQWQALRTFPELVAVVEEGVSSARASVAPLTPPSQLQSAAPGLVQPAGVLADPFAAPSAPTVEKAELPDFALPRRRGTGAAAWIAVVVALLFGLTIGFVLFSREKPEPIVKIVEVPAKTAQPAAAAATEPASSAETEAVEIAADPGSGKMARASGPSAAKVPENAPEKSGLSGLKGLSAVSGQGPSAGPGTGASSGAGSGQLDSDQVQRVVSRYTASVRRSCWQPALDTRAPDAPSSARVSVAITVSPSGSVSGATTSGDPKGYRGLASCIAGRVRGWQFPASSDTTTVNVPFYFAAQ